MGRTISDSGAIKVKYIVVSVLIHFLAGWSTDNSPSNKKNYQSSKDSGRSQVSCSLAGAESISKV